MRLLLYNFLEDLFLEKLERGGNLVDKLMAPPVLTEVKIQAAHRRRGNPICFVEIYRGVTSHEPSDAEITRHLECLGQSDVVS